MAQGRMIISVDAGGSSIRSGVVGPGGYVYHITHTPIDATASAETILDMLAVVIHGHLRRVPPDWVRGAAFGFPAPFDYSTGVSLIAGTERYAATYGIDIGAALRERLDDPTWPMVFCNADEATVVGEMLYGAGKPYNRLIGITLGTDLASLFAADGMVQIDGFGVPANGALYGADFDGEMAGDVFSTRGLLTRFLAAGHTFSAVGLPKVLADQGDAAVCDVFASFGADLGRFMAPWVAQFGADALLVFGDISVAFTHFGPAMCAALDIPVLTGSQGPAAALQGAATLLLE